jgi:hypothetical protein
MEVSMIAMMIHYLFCASSFVFPRTSFTTQCCTLEVCFGVWQKCFRLPFIRQHFFEYNDPRACCLPRSSCTAAGRTRLCLAPFCTAPNGRLEFSKHGGYGIYRSLELVGLYKILDTAVRTVSSLQINDACCAVAMRARARARARAQRCCVLPARYQYGE